MHPKKMLGPHGGRVPSFDNFERQVKLSKLKLIIAVEQELPAAER